LHINRIRRRLLPSSSGYSHPGDRRRQVEMVILPPRRASCAEL
jgi:hypothetical protein